MMDLITILNDMLEPEGGDLSICDNGAGHLIRWQPDPGDSLIQYHLEPKVLENALNIEDLAAQIANFLEQRYKELSQSFPIHPLQPLKDLPDTIKKTKKDNPPSDHATDAASYAISSGHIQIPIFGKSNDNLAAKPPPAGPILLLPQQPIQVDGKELVAAVMKEVTRLAPEHRLTHQMMALEPSYVLVKDQGLVWFTFHAPYFIQYVHRRSGQFELGEQGLKVVKAMVREVQGIYPEGTILVEGGCHGDEGPNGD